MALKSFKPFTTYFLRRPDIIANFFCVQTTVYRMSCPRRAMVQSDRSYGVYYEYNPQPSGVTCSGTGGVYTYLHESVS